MTQMSRLAQRQQSKGSILFSLSLFIATFYFFSRAHAQSQGSNLTRDEVSEMISASINDIQQLGQTYVANLITDLTPFLALFGDHTVREFMSQSNCWPDYIIFSLGPLGLPVAMITAVRLCGPHYFKRVIGKGRESIQEAELALTSATSESVCEVWDGASIVRLIGQPVITELRIDSNSSYIMPLRRTTEGGQDAEKAPITGPPNLLLNATGKDISFTAKWLIAIISITLQLGVLAYAGVVQFYLPKPQFQKDGQMGSYKLYPFFNVLFGTLSMNASMLLCSYSFDKAMHRHIFRPYKEEKWRPCWIQHGEAGSQFLDSYIIFGAPRSSKNGVITTLHPWRDHGGRFIPPHVTAYVSVAVILGILGFLFQVIGLRELHFSVPAAVLGQTLLMALLRVYVRSEKNTDKVHVVKLPQKFELEWLATRAGRLWVELEKLDNAGSGRSSNTLDRTDKFWMPSCYEEWNVITGRPVVKKNIMIVRLDAGELEPEPEPEPVSTVQGDSIGSTDATMGPAMPLPDSIQRLISLKQVQSCSGPKGQSSDLVIGLLKSMRHALNTLLPPNIKEWKSRFGVDPFKSPLVSYLQFSDFGVWKWPLHVEILCKAQSEKPTLTTQTPVMLTFQKTLNGWSVTDQEVESLLHFWLFTLSHNTGPNTPKSGSIDNIKLFGANNARSQWDITKWNIDYGQVYEVRPWTETSTPMREAKEIRFTMERNHGGVMGVSTIDSGLVSPNHEEHLETASNDRTVNIFAGRTLPQTLEEYTRNEYPLLATRTECTLDQHCAQELFFRFILAIGAFMREALLIRVAGNTTLVPPNTADELAPKRKLILSKFLNSTLDKLAVGTYNTGLCNSLEAAYNLIIPPLSLAGVLPEVGGVISSHATEMFRELVKRDEWLKAADLFDWVYNSMRKSFGCMSEEEVYAIATVMNFIAKLCEKANSESYGSNRGKPLAERAEAMLQELAVADNDVVRAVGLMMESLQELDDKMDTWLVYQGNDTEKGVQELKEENGRDLREQYSKYGLFDILGFTSGHRFTTANTNAAYTKAVDAETAKSRDILQRLPLHYAAGNRELSCEKLEVIIELTGGVDQRDIDDNTPLHFAASSGNVEFIQLLQKKMEILKVNFNAANILGRTPLHRAAAKGGSGMVTLLLEKGASIDLEDVSRRTALHHAALGGDIGVVDALLAQRANPAAVDIHGRYPLHIAAATGNTVMVRRLIKSSGGALLKMTDKDGKTALDLVLANAKEKIADFEDNPPEDTPSELYDLHDLLKELLITEEGRNRGWSPLHSAVHSGEKTAVEALLKLDSVLASGGEPLLNLRDTDGATPLHVAARAGHWKLVELLIEKNCDLSSKDRNDEGALMLAVKHEHADVVEVLLKRMNSDSRGWGWGWGCDVDVDVVSKERNSMGINPLHWAAANGNYGLVVKLVQVGFAEPKACDKLGMTALHYAVLMGHEDVAGYLLEQDINLVDATDLAGDTPLHCAAAGGRVRIVELLLDKFFVQPGQDPILVRDGTNDLYLRYYIMRRNNAGETALHCAARGMTSPYFKRMMIFYNGTMLDPEIFTKLDLTFERWHRNIISSVQCPCPEGQNKIAEWEFDGLYHGGYQWQDEFIKLLLTLNGDYVDWSLGSNAAGVAQLLLDNGADIEALDNNEESPLHLAARWGRLDIAKALLQGQEITTPSDSAPGEAPTDGSPIWEKANVHARDIHEDTPLHLAARWGYGDIVELLVDEGANVEDGNQYGQSPKDVAEHHLQFEVVSLLQELQKRQELQHERRSPSSAGWSGTGAAVPAASGQSAYHRHPDHRT